MNAYKEADIRRFLSNSGFKLKDLKKVIAKMVNEKYIDEDTWQKYPDRSGGQFTQDEINDTNWK